MQAVPIVVLGAGNLACSVPVVASLATYFGERPLDLRLWDADPERLDLIDRLARVCFAVARSTHELKALEDPVEACDDATGAIVTLDAHGAARYRRIAGPGAGEGVADALRHVAEALPAGAAVLDLVEAAEHLLAERPPNWPIPLHPMALRVFPHQVLRWIRGDEYVTELLATHEGGPIKGWLDSLVVRSS